VLSGRGNLWEVGRKFDGAEVKTKEILMIRIRVDEVGGG
jgi:hypothetical protein